MNKKELSFQEAQDEFKKVIGIGVQRIFRSIGTYLFIDLGNMRQWSVKSSATDEVFTSEEGDYTLEFEGRWVHRKSDVISLDPNGQMFSDDSSEFGKKLDAYVSELKITHFSDVTFHEETQSIAFHCNDGSTLEVFVDEFGLVNLHNRLNSTITFFDKEEGSFFQEAKSPASNE
jgi:hypothetical protein